jgi:hypothetical protein
VSGFGHRLPTTRTALGRSVLARALVVAVLVGGATGCATAASRLNVEDVYARTISARTAQTAIDLHIGAPRAGTYVTAQGRADLTTPGFAMAVQEAGLSLNELRRGDRLYLEVPASARAANQDKPWAEFDLRTGRGPGSGDEVEPALMGPVLMAAGPAPVLDLLRLAPTSVARLGPDRLNGEPSTEYRLYYSTTELTSSRPRDALRAGLVSLLAQIAHPRPAEIPVYVWLDHQGRLVRLDVSVVLGTEPVSPSPAQAALANQLPVILNVDFYFGHFGEPVRLVPPATARINQLPLSQLEGGTL